MTMVECAGVILVGGKSSRMESDKALLPWSGVRLVDYVAGVLREAGITNVYVSGKVDGYTCIPDAGADNLGPVMGVCTSLGILRYRYHRIIFLPVDMPLITKHIIVQLSRNADFNLACHFQNNPLPFAMQSSSMALRHADSVLRHLSEGMECSVKKFLEPFKPYVIDADAEIEIALTNTNTPEEWWEAIYESAHQ